MAEEQSQSKNDSAVERMARVIEELPRVIKQTITDGQKETGTERWLKVLIPIFVFAIASLWYTHDTQLEELRKTTILLTTNQSLIQRDIDEQKDLFVYFAKKIVSKTDTLTPADIDYLEERFKVIDKEDPEILYTVLKSLPLQYSYITQQKNIISDTPAIVEEFAINPNLVIKLYIIGEDKIKKVYGGIIPERVQKEGEIEKDVAILDFVDLNQSDFPFGINMFLSVDIFNSIKTYTVLLV